MTFPTTPEDLTSEWLRTALDTTITSFQVEHFGEGAGIIGMVTRVHLTGPDAPPTIIAKFPSPAEENRAVAATYDMYHREIQFYRQIAGEINLRVPLCYCAEFDPERSEFILLMEDLQSMRIGDQVAGCNQTDARLVVEGIARFHASTWNSKHLIVSHNNPAQRDGMAAGFEMGWPVVQKQFPEFIPAGVDTLVQKMPDKVGELLDKMTTGPVCIVHADVRLDNIFFGTDEIALVDWQSVCTSAPEQDLAYFVTQSLSDEVRNAYGRNRFGQGCLLARRLVERGVRFVEVVRGGWDTHSENFDQMGDLCPPVDRALAALLADLQARGLLDEITERYLRLEATGVVGAPPQPTSEEE